MASGKTHDELNKIIITPMTCLFGISIYSIMGEYTWIGLISFYLGGQMGRLLTPDSDQDIKTYGEWLFGLFDPYLGKVFEWWFLPYAKIIPHRSIWSHYPVISPLIRLLYLLFPFWILSWIIKPINNIFQLLYYNWDLVIYWFIGFFIVDLAHLFLDFNYLFRKEFEKWICQRN